MAESESYSRLDENVEPNQEQNYNEQSWIKHQWLAMVRLLTPVFGSLIIRIKKEFGPTFERYCAKYKHYKMNTDERVNRRLEGSSRFRIMVGVMIMLFGLCMISNEAAAIVDHQVAKNVNVYRGLDIGMASALFAFSIWLLTTRKLQHGKQLFFLIFVTVVLLSLLITLAMFTLNSKQSQRSVSELSWHYFNHYSEQAHILSFFHLNHDGQYLYPNWAWAMSTTLVFTSLYALVATVLSLLINLIYCWIAPDILVEAELTKRSARPLKCLGAVAVIGAVLYNALYCFIDNVEYKVSYQGVVTFEDIAAAVCSISVGLMAMFSTRHSKLLVLGALLAFGLALASEVHTSETNSYSRYSERRLYDRETAGKVCVRKYNDANKFCVEDSKICDGVVDMFNYNQYITAHHTDDTLLVGMDRLWWSYEDTGLMFADETNCRIQGRWFWMEVLGLTANAVSCLAFLMMVFVILCSKVKMEPKQDVLIVEEPNESHNVADESLTSVEDDADQDAV